jgi:hypothetical protein
VKAVTVADAFQRIEHQVAKFISVSHILAASFFVQEALDKLTLFSICCFKETLIFGQELTDDGMRGG